MSPPFYCQLIARLRIPFSPSARAKMRLREEGLDQKRLGDDAHHRPRRFQVVIEPRQFFKLAFIGNLLFAWTFTTTALAGGAVQPSGDVLQFALPALAIGATIGHRNEDDGRLWDRQGTLQFAESAAVTLGVTYALKYGLNTTRPNGGGHSMPSGHSSISFSSAEFLRKRYGWEWGVPAYAAASWVAYSRVESKQHHPEDVIVGAGIGILSSYIFTKPYHGWDVTLTADTRSVGLLFSRAW